MEGNKHTYKKPICIVNRNNLTKTLRNWLWRLITHPFSF